MDHKSGSYLCHPSPAGKSSARDKARSPSNKNLTVTAFQEIELDTTANTSPEEIGSPSAKVPRSGAKKRTLLTPFQEVKIGLAPTCSRNETGHPSTKVPKKCARKGKKGPTTTITPPSSTETSSSSVSKPSDSGNYWWVPPSKERTRKEHWSGCQPLWTFVRTLMRKPGLCPLPGSELLALLQSPGPRRYTRSWLQLPPPPPRLLHPDRRQPLRQYRISHCPALPRSP